MSWRRLLSALLAGALWWTIAPASACEIRAIAVTADGSLAEFCKDGSWIITHRDGTVYRLASYRDRQASKSPPSLSEPVLGGTLRAAASPRPFLKICEKD